MKQVGCAKELGSGLIIKYMWRAKFPNLNLLSFNTAGITESILFNFHVGETLKGFKLQAGDDAGAVAWMAATSKLNLYANHIDFIHKVVELRHAAW